MERSRRSRTSRNKHAGVLEQIAELRKGGGGKRRADVYSLKDSGDVYETMTEEDYASLVATRRDAAEFVVDDGGDYGYADDGEEEDWGSGTKKKPTKKNISKVARESRKRQKTEQLKPKNKVSSMFLGRSGTYVGPDRASKSEDTAEGDDDFLDNLISGLDDTTEDGDSSSSTKQSMKNVAIFGHASELTEMEYIEEEEAPSSDEIFTPAVGGPKLKSAEVGDDEVNVVTNLEALFGTVENDSEASAPAESAPVQASNVASSSSGATANHSPSLSSAAAVVPTPSKKLVTNSASAVHSPPATPAAVRPTPTATPSSKSTSMPPSAPASAPNETSSEWAAISKSLHKSTAGNEAKEVSVAELANEEELKVYWFDSHSEPLYKPGTVFLFGRLQLPGGETESVCVRVNNIERNIYVLPRKYMLKDPTDAESKTDTLVRMQDVYAEVKHLLNTCGVQNFKAKPVERKYCFNRDSSLRDLNDNELQTDSLLDPEEGVPKQTQYLKTVYGFKAGRAPPRNTQGRTFSKLFGTQSSAEELFVLKRNLMGPGWLKIKNFRSVPEKEQHLSHCKYEFVVDSPKDVVKMDNAPEAPSFNVMSLSLQTILNPKTNRNEIVTVTGIIHRKVSVEGPTKDEKALESFTVVRNMPSTAWPFDFKSAIKKKLLKIQIAPNERALLNLVAQKIYLLDPDILVGHDLHGFQLEMLLMRMHALKVGAWSKLGRLKKNNMPKSLTSHKSGSSFSLADQGVISGRMLCDIQTSAKELIRQSNFSLTDLARTQLGDSRKTVDVSKVPHFFNSTKELLALIGLNEQDAWMTLMIMFRLVVLPLTLQLTQLCGNMWARSLRSKRAERIEYLLLHEFHRLKYIVPEKFSGREMREMEQAKKQARGDMSAVSTKRRKKAAYAGGMVLEPKRGFYDTFILLLDFNSLYPSIIQEFNICFTTIKHWEPVAEGTAAELPEQVQSQGQLPKVMYRLLERRRQVKKILKTERNATKKEQLDIRQKALKLVANSMYGCLGYDKSRFYCAPLAALVTGKGREILGNTVELSNTLGYTVVYGDTDSIMINSNSDDVAASERIGKEIKKAVNKRYKVLEIEIDGIYKNMLLLRKKKYAALNLQKLPDGSGYSATKEIKGLDIVRRDWSVLAKEVGHFVIDQILSSKSREDVIDAIHNKLTEVKDLAHANKIPLEKYITTKGLTKNPQDYPDKNNQPHVLVALEMIQAGKVVRGGDFIQYVVCEGEGNMAQRCHSPDFFKKANGELKIDVNWYLSNNVLPVVARMTDVIPETSTARIADCLGLDGSKFHQYAKTNTEALDDDDIMDAGQIDDKEKYKECTKFEIACPRCKEKFQLVCIKDVEEEKAPPGGKNEVIAPSGLFCKTVGCVGPIDPATAAKDAHAVSIQIANSLALAMREHADKYYAGWFRCSEHPECANRSRQMSVTGDQCWGCRTGKMEREYSGRDLYTQLCYYQSLFAIDKSLAKITKLNTRRRNDPTLGPEILTNVPETHKQVFQNLYKFMEENLARSAYHHVSLKSLFSFVFDAKKK